MPSDRTLWILGNYKQNLLRQEVHAQVQALVPRTRRAREQHPKLRVGIAPVALHLHQAQLTRDEQEQGCTNPLRLLSQNVGDQPQGAFTGETGAAMLVDAGCELAIVGHSERRALYGEDDALLARKVKACVQAGLGVVLCVGESLPVREAQRHEAVVLDQLKAALAQFPWDCEVPLVLAYEPVWAIGTGKSATPEQASQMHGMLREALATLDPARGRGRSILYGGSVKPANASALLAAGNIDGFLVGGASLNVETFAPICDAAAEHLSS